MSRKKLVIQGVIFQSLFTRRGKLARQKTLLSYLRLSHTTKQTTLDNWFFKHECNSQVKQTTVNNTAEPLHRSQKFSADFFTIFDNTISCIELDMKHDRCGNVIGWMEKEPKTEKWNSRQITE